MEGRRIDGEEAVRSSGCGEFEIKEDMVVEDAREEVEGADNSDEASWGSGGVRRG